MARDCRAQLVSRHRKFHQNVKEYTAIQPMMDAGGGINGIRVDRFFLYAFVRIKRRAGVRQTLAASNAPILREATSGIYIRIPGYPEFRNAVWQVRLDIQASPSSNCQAR
jgi:isocitrate/isopropylmalate dehydrogenase